VGAALSLCPSDPDRQIRILRKKLAAGVDFFLTQPVFEVDKAREFLDYYAQRYGKLETPILAGVLPLVTDRHARFLHNEVPGIEIPEAVQERMANAGDDMLGEGKRIAVELIREIKKTFQGIYVMPAFNRFDMIADIIKTAKK
jgi:homocysteine S-methyltransferase